MAYLYGASIQGIQGFVFESNELKNIIGASEIVKKFDEIDFAAPPFNCSGEIEKLLQAAGNIRLKIESEDDAKNIVMHFPKYIMQMAYGITVSQALVKEEGEDPRGKLESYIKAQRNKVSPPLDYSLNITKLYSKNARAEVADDTKGVSMGVLQKLQAFKYYQKERNHTETYEISKLSNAKNKIAVIHADGNGMGEIVRHYIGDDMAAFSKALDKATKDAFQKAKQIFPQKQINPYREVILGGDDLTLICDADYALAFTACYLHHFQTNTEKNLSKFKKSIALDNYTGKMTACAGIAFCHEKYPFHMAVSLAEDLCKHAKEASGRSKSCVMFHNIQDSYYESFSVYLDRELSVKPNTNDDKPVSFCYGPYYLEGGDVPTLKQLEERMRLFRQEASPLASLREWVETLHHNQKHANTLLKRIVKNSERHGWEGGFTQSDYLECDEDGCKTFVYDILQLHAATHARKEQKECSDEEV